MKELLNKIKEVLKTQKSVSLSDRFDEFKIIDKLFCGYGYNNHDEDDNRTDGWFDHVHNTWINKDLGLMIEFSDGDGDYTWDDYVCTYTITKFDENSAGYDIWL